MTFFAIFSLLSLFLWDCPVFHANFFPVPDRNIQEIDVTHYRLHIEIPDLSGKNIYGRADIRLMFPEPGNRQGAKNKQISLDLVSMQVDTVWINGKITQQWTREDSSVRIMIPNEINFKEEWEVGIRYHGMLGRDLSWGGFYFRDGHAFNMGVAMGADPPVFGRGWFPCHDSFTDKATFEFHVDVPECHTAVCNGTLTGVSPDKDGMKTFHWSLRDPIPTYLASIAVGNYVALRDTFQGKLTPVPASVYVNPGDSLKALRSFARLEENFTLFEKLFGPYRWERIGFVSVPFSGGAMEHATNIAVSAITITGDNTFETLFAHELAHSWFGNLVTCESAPDMWLNEGWASYAEILFREFLFGKETGREYFRDNQLKVLQFTHLWDEGFFPVSDVPHRVTYGSTVYDKGSSVVHTLRHYLGDRTFFGFLRQYFSDYAFSSIGIEEFENYMIRVTGIDLTNFFETWVYSPGFVHYSAKIKGIEKTAGSYHVDLMIRQRTKGERSVSISDSLDLLFMNEQGQRCIRRLRINGPYTEKKLPLPFSPSMVYPDPHDKLADAVTVDEHMIRSVGDQEFDRTFFDFQATGIRDSVFITVLNHWIGPEPDALPEDVVFSDRRYWSVICNHPEAVDGQMHFHYDGYEDSGHSPDYDLLDGAGQGPALFFRCGCGEAWEKIPSCRFGDSLRGYFSVDGLITGDYILGIAPDRRVRGRVRDERLKHGKRFAFR